MPRRGRRPKLGPVISLLFEMYAAVLVTGILWAVGAAFRLGSEES